MTADAYITELAAQLYGLRDTSAVLRQSRQRAPGYAPRLHECHRNADAWVSLHPHHRVVRGWLLFDYSLSQFPMMRFQAHSAVEDENGRLLDVTPHDAPGPLHFLRHPDGNDMFDLAVSRREIVSISHRLK